MATNNPQLSFDSKSLPIAQLELLKFKANQIIESIQTLQRTIDVGGQQAMPAWPDILSKYNVILSQTHSFSQSLSSPQAQSQLVQAQARLSSSVYEKIALHPSVGMTDAQLDNDLIPLLRNQQTTDVLNMETATVRRLAECMATRGAIATNGVQTNLPPTTGSRVTHEDVLQECEEIRSAHDHRVERAVRAVMMLRDKFEWKQRVEVEVEEPEELEWDPRTGHGDAQMINETEIAVSPDNGELGEGQSSDEEDIVEGELTGNDGPTPVATPAAVDVEMTSADAS
ncbi:hypothetical protein DEU56DRAFT_819643 [Suillus clintonianus]|uniref:uncharacterized protein n=1 Tax=Suillus clintonianus TaxID=1904413 RepID=UPI001B87A68C|nr:uncharacterized protein DEU56DRAFT_819643 [Suillus clintonianus]KAG2127960.1 hypothetical protein DEU56DRAFT_819643 [Suillus clintonianus]